MKVSITSLTDEKGKNVTCVFKSKYGSCNELPANLEFGVLCKDHMALVNLSFRSWKKFKGVSDE